MHGAGRPGKEAWPQQGSAEALFVDHTGYPTMSAKAHAVGEQSSGGPVVVIAHSLGAVIAAIAAQREYLDVSHFLLAEPALYDIARGDTSIEHHIASMSQARQFAQNGDLYRYWEIVSPMMFRRPASRARWDSESAFVARFAAMEPPWGHGIAAETFRQVPTLVVTGAWNNEYEAIAARLTRVGAQHVQLPGFGHRVQDHPDFNQLLDALENGQLTSA